MLVAFARRVLVLRFAVLRLAGVLDVFEAPVLALFALERLAGDLRAVDVRLAPALADFALVERLAVERFVADLRAPGERFEVDLRAGFAALPELLDVLAEPSVLHLPVMTR